MTILLLLATIFLAPGAAKARPWRERDLVSHTCAGARAATLTLATVAQAISIDVLLPRWWVSALHRILAPKRSKWNEEALCSQCGLAGSRRGRSFVKPVGEDKARARCGLAGSSDWENGRWGCGWSCGRSRPMEGRTASSPPAGDKADWAASKI